jgi:uncharacterized membrane protein
VIAILLAASFFVGVHLLVAGTGLRARLVVRLGERLYLALFSLLAVVGIVWLSRAWAVAVPAEPHWNGSGFRTLVLIAMFFAFQLVAIGLTTPSPTATGGEGALDSEEPARGILRVTRHPFLWGVMLWGLCHLLVNPDAPSLLFFGSLLLLAVLGPLSIDAKRRRKYGERWDRFAAVTSNLPFAAIVAGRNRLVLGELGVWRIALGALLYAGTLALHATLFGASPL